MPEGERDSPRFGTPPLPRCAGMQSLPSSPPGPTPLAAPPNAEAWRSRFVISAKANTPTLTLLGSGHEPPIHRLVEATCAALDSKTPPMLVDDGLGGTYFIKGLDGTCDWPRSNLGRTDLRSADLVFASCSARRLCLQAVRRGAVRAQQPEAGAAGVCSAAGRRRHVWHPHRPGRPERVRGMAH